ncbi:hypothetical protein CHLNCDRAFT_136516 [Chlorella variabilis]|uniref:Hyaluronan/mRNA-binding protein domain-containing protein n=1 Tax=Chlorella variabilis TaxID=554065 RepID=E1ZKI2_CHLVA|nr:hypothetical protein CHLNCDRAFT_136516 [Chlorella variabilis]EFN53810.1 hypothetical protein CHLNCDRAFT_136516 [Chlorella variabilis]|eukprot:XP_005845912.1 hypothetical protein CHLNCDRAFT_136516 [Chlorella variabilis]
MTSPKGARDEPTVNFRQADEAYDELSAPTYEGRGNTPKMTEGKSHATHPRKGDRLFDRHDASGRAHELEKKHGAGKANWGVEGEAQEELDLAVQQSLARDAELDAANPQMVSEADAPGEENVMTLEEFEALQRELSKPEQGGPA